MKNLEKLGVQELNTMEIKNVDGGGWLYDLGAAAHRAWCDIKDSFQEYCENRQTHFDNGYGHGPM